MKIMIKSRFPLWGNVVMTILLCVFGVENFVERHWLTSLGLGVMAGIYSHFVWEEIKFVDKWKKR